MLHYRLMGHGLPADGAYIFNSFVLPSLRPKRQEKTIKSLKFVHQTLKIAAFSGLLSQILCLSRAKKTNFWNFTNNHFLSLSFWSYMSIVSLSMRAKFHIKHIIITKVLDSSLFILSTWLKPRFLRRNPGFVLYQSLTGSSCNDANACYKNQRYLDSYRLMCVCAMGHEFT